MALSVVGFYKLLYPGSNFPVTKDRHLLGETHLRLIAHYGINSWSFTTRLAELPIFLDVCQHLKAKYEPRLASEIPLSKLAIGSGRKGWYLVLVYVPLCVNPLVGHPFDMVILHTFFIKVQSMTYEISVTIYASTFIVARKPPKKCSNKKNKWFLFLSKITIEHLRNGSHPS